MSLPKRVLTFLFSSLFLIFLFLSINSYTIGNLVKKESIKNFVREELSPSIIRKSCEEVCASVEQKDLCMSRCLSEFSNKTDEMIDRYLDEYYNKEFFGFTFNQISRFFSNSYIFILLSVVFAVPLFFLSEKPVRAIGLNLLSVGVSMLLISLMAIFSLKDFITLPVEIEPILDYVTFGLRSNVYVSIILLSVGVFFLLISFYKSKRTISPSRRTSRVK
jgi:hypothetical protein